MSEPQLYLCPDCQTTSHADDIGKTTIQKFTEMVCPHCGFKNDDKAFECINQPDGTLAVDDGEKIS